MSGDLQHNIWWCFGKIPPLEVVLRALGEDIGRLSSSHVELAQRVAVIEGYLRGRADQAATQSLLPKDRE